MERINQFKLIRIKSEGQIVQNYCSRAAFCVKTTICAVGSMFAIRLIVAENFSEKRMKRCEKKRKEIFGERERERDLICEKSSVSKNCAFRSPTDLNLMIPLEIFSLLLFAFKSFQLHLHATDFFENCKNILKVDYSKSSKT